MDGFWTPVDTKKYSFLKSEVDYQHPHQQYLNHILIHFENPMISQQYQATKMTSVNSYQENLFNSITTSSFFGPLSDLDQGPSHPFHHLNFTYQLFYFLYLT